MVATKYTVSAVDGDPNSGGNHRRSMIRSVERSLRRLRTDWIDLLWLHLWDGSTSTDEVLRAMDDLVRSGKILHVGFSNSPAWVVAAALATAGLRGWTGPTAIQAPYHFAHRDAERELLPMAAAYGIPMLAWGILGGGVLTGKYSAPGGPARRYGDLAVSDRVRSLTAAVTEAARQMDATPAQVLMSWQRHNPWSSRVIPIVGVRSAAQLAENLDALALALPGDVLAALTEAANFTAGFPVDFLGGAEARQLIFGRTRPTLGWPSGSGAPEF